ncbi:MAG: 3-methyl-2-oxobutanoate hydroxymethyltransferase [Candidatus Omnitrophica bacterium]|nr:3-methyl-2-oxobutanoate hydroxymethyltransferase [Candidatus Omnitrophota bacterium]
MSRLTIKQFKQKKRVGKKIAMLTAYDYAFAKIIDEACVDAILVGDSLANVVLGLDSTKDVTMDQMIYHAKAVSRGAKNALVIGDMPFEAYQKNPKHAVKNARRFIKEGGCHGVKIEWFSKCLFVVKNIIAVGIPVMGHIGLTPQTAEALGGFKVQGKDADSARNIIDQAVALEKMGCFSLVLECVPDKVARLITKKIKIPTIGIGAGPWCDGQILVMHDVFGLFDRFRPKFTKQYVDAGTLIKHAAQNYCKDVSSGKFPSKKQSFAITDEEFKQLR